MCCMRYTSELMLNILQVFCQTTYGIESYVLYKVLIYRMRTVKAVNQSSIVPLS